MRQTKINKEGFIYLSFTGILETFGVREFSAYNIVSLKDSIEAFNELDFEYKINIANGKLDILEEDAESETHYKIKDIVEKLYQKLYSRFGDMILCKYEQDKDSEEELKNLYYSIYQALLKIVRIADETIPKYETLLKLYQAKKDNILNELKVISNSITKHNDTPQGEGDFSDDIHTSDINKNHLEQVREDSLISRLKEIDDSFKNCYEDWIMEFEKIFIEEINL